MGLHVNESNSGNKNIHVPGYIVADTNARNSLTGMVQSDLLYEQDTNTPYIYDGVNWNPLGTSQAFVPYSGATVGVDLNNKSLVDVSLLSVGSATPPAFNGVIYSNGYVGVFNTNPVSPIDVHQDSLTTPGISVGVGGAFQNFVGISGGRAMLGYDPNTSMTVINSGNGKGLNIFLNGTNNSFLSGTLGATMPSGGGFFLKIGAQTLSALTPLGAIQPGQLNAGGTGSSSAIYSGTGVPSNSFGSNGDYYFRSDTPGSANQRIYVRASGSWSGIV